MSNEIHPFFWQFRRPLSRLGGSFAQSEGTHEADLSLVERVLVAYRLALNTSVGSNANVWLEHFAKHNAQLHNVLVHGDIETASGILRDPSSSDLFLGFDGPTITDIKLSEQLFMRHMTERYVYDVLTSLAEALKVVRVENPEAIRTGEVPPVDTLLDRIDEALGIKVVFPSPFRNENGIQTSRGVISHRAAMALYQAWKIFDLVGNNPDARILEIGAGLGRNAMFAHQLGARNYTIIDLPTTNVAQGYFLGRTLGADKVQLYGEDRTTYVEVAPSEKFLKGDDTFDLVANIDSMTEFSRETAIDYVKQISSRAKQFLSINHEANSFSIHEIVAEVCPSLKMTRTPSWIRQGYVEEVATF